MAHGLQTELYVRETRPRHRVPAFSRPSGPPPEPVPPRNNWPLAVLIVVVVAALMAGWAVIDGKRERAEAREQARQAARAEVVAEIESDAGAWVDALVARETRFVLMRSCPAVWQQTELISDSTVLPDTDRTLGGVLTEARQTRVQGEGDSYTVTFDGTLAGGESVEFVVWLVPTYDWWGVCGVDGPDPAL